MPDKPLVVIVDDSEAMALIGDARFAAIRDRRKNQKQMWAILTEFASKYTKRELMEIVGGAEALRG